MALLRRRTLAPVFFLIAVLIAAFFLARWIPFSASDVVVSTDAPSEIDIGNEVDIHVTVTNKTRATLREGSIALDLPEALELIEAVDTDFALLAPRSQVTARFRIRAMGNPGEKANIRARVRFRPRQLSAFFEKETRATIELRDLPFDLTFSFPSDAASGTTFTFFLRFSSRANAPIGPVGVSLDTPSGFHISRARPNMVRDVPNLWDFGDFEPGFREEIAVTGFFDPDATGGTFTAQIGLLDATRRRLMSFKGVQEELNVQRGALPIDLVIDGLENPYATVVSPGETIDIDIHYINATDTPIEDISIALAFAHEAIRQRSIVSSEPFTRSVSGEYVWDRETLPGLKLFEAGEEKTITFSADLVDQLMMRAFSDANQSITVRVRAFSEGRILGERQVRLKIAGAISTDADVRYYGAIGGSNSGPLPPEAGKATSYTVTLTVAGGTNGFDDTVVRVVLGPAVTYDELITPEDAEVAYDEAAREVRWDLGDLPPGVGILSPPSTLTFRIVLIPRAEDVGSIADLLTTVSVAGEDNFVDRILDASDAPVDSTLPDDHKVTSMLGFVRSATP